jgi:hypothetical protein
MVQQRPVSVSCRLAVPLRPIIPLKNPRRLRRDMSSRSGQWALDHPLPQVVQGLTEKLHVGQMAHACHSQRARRGRKAAGSMIGNLMALLQNPYASHPIPQSELIGAQALTRRTLSCV